MFAWMNADALERTLDTGYAHFWTRSRKRLWMKGEESGNRLVELHATPAPDHASIGGSKRRAMAFLRGSPTSAALVPPGSAGLR